MYNWTGSTINDVCEKVCVGFVGTYSNAQTNESLGIPMIRTTNLTEGGIQYTNLTYVTQEFHSRNVKSQLKKGDILVARHGDNGKACMFNETFEANCLNVVIIRPDNTKINPKFLLYQFNSPIIRNTIGSQATGSVQDVINTKDIAKLEINVPPLHEQNAIAEVLSSLNDKIDLLHRNNKTLEEMAEMLFLSCYKKIEFDANCLSKFGNYFAETIGGEWGKEEFSEINPYQAVCIRGTDIGNLESGIAKPPVRYLTENKIKKCKLADGDIVIEISGGTDDQSTGRAKYFNSNLLELYGNVVVFSNFCRLLRPEDTSYTYFLYLYLRMLYKRGDFFNLENGTSGIKNLDLKALLYSEEYPFPSRDEMSRISSGASVFFGKFTQNLLQIEKLTSMRDLLLPKLMSGALRVKDFTHAHELSVL